MKLRAQLSYNYFNADLLIANCALILTTNNEYVPNMVWIPQLRFSVFSLSEGSLFRMADFGLYA